MFCAAKSERETTGTGNEKRRTLRKSRSSSALLHTRPSQRWIVHSYLACSRLRDGGGKSFSNKECEKRAGAGDRQVVRFLFSLCSF